jgi:hypothetical protein
VLPKRRFEEEEFEWMCIMLLGAAVQGRWRGELGEAWTGRKNCWSERGEGMKSRVKVGGGVLRLGCSRGGTLTIGGELTDVGVRSRAGRVQPAYGDFLSTSEQ